MSATATPTATPSSDGRTARRPLARGTQLVHEPAPSAPQERGGVVLFQVPFASTMSDSDLALLARTLDLVTHMHPKMHPDPNLSLIHISEPTRLGMISYAVFCLKKKKKV